MIVAIYPIMLSIVMLSVIYSVRIVAAKPIMVYVIMLNVKIYHSILSVDFHLCLVSLELCGIMLSVTIYPTMLSIVFLGVAMLCGIYATPCLS